MTTRPLSEPDIEIALDELFRRSLPAPALPLGFRGRLRTALAATSTSDVSDGVEALEKERREGLAVMRARFYAGLIREVGRGVAIGATAMATTVSLAPFVVRFAEFPFATPAYLAIGIVGVGIAAGLWWRPRAVPYI